MKLGKNLVRKPSKQSTGGAPKKQPHPEIDGKELEVKVWAHRPVVLNDKQCTEILKVENGLLFYRHKRSHSKNTT